MLTVIYSDEVKYKLKLLTDKLVILQGEEKGKKTIEKILSVLDGLGCFPNVGMPINERYDVDCPDNWYLLYTNKNYFVFSKTKERIEVLEMYDNRQDFINELFGVEMRSSESKKFWNE